MPTDAVRLEALRLLSRRDFTTAELREELLARDFPSDEIQEAIVRLRDERLLDDRRVAAAHVRTASRVKHRGRRRIQMELEARGIDRALVRELLAELPADAELEAIRALLQRRPLPPRPTPAERRRLYQQLLRRGFSADLIARVLGGRIDE